MQLCLPHLSSRGISPWLLPLLLFCSFIALAILSLPVIISTFLKSSTNIDWSTHPLSAAHSFSSSLASLPHFQSLLISSQFFASATLLNFAHSNAHSVFLEPVETLRCYTVCSWAWSSEVWSTSLSLDDHFLGFLAQTGGDFIVIPSTSHIVSRFSQILLGCLILPAIHFLPRCLYCLLSPLLHVPIKG